MKVRIVKRVPVEEKHGIRVGRVFEIDRLDAVRGKSSYVVMGDAGEEVFLYRFEAIIVDEGTDE